MLKAKTYSKKTGRKNLTNPHKRNKFSTGTKKKHSKQKLISKIQEVNMTNPQKKKQVFSCNKEKSTQSKHLFQKDRK